MAFLRGGERMSPPLADLDDKSVLELSFSNPRAFEAIVDRYQDGFLRTAHRIVRSREEAEDVVQEAFVKIYFRGETFKDKKGATFQSWAYRILLNVAYTHYRKSRRREVPLEEFFDVILYQQSVAISREEMEDLNRRETVAKALNHLPQDLAEILRLHYFEGYSYKDISFETGLTVSALKTRLWRARKQFRDYFLKISPDSNQTEPQ